MPSVAEAVLFVAVLSLAASTFPSTRRGRRDLRFPDRLGKAVVIPMTLGWTLIVDVSTHLGADITVAARLRGTGVIVAALILLWANRAHFGPPLQAIALTCALGGVALNALATVVHGGMPVVVSSARSVGMVPGPRPPRDGYVWVQEPTLFDWATADSVPLSGLHTVFSSGDVLQLIGFPLLLAWFLVGALRSAAPTSPTQATRGGVR